MEVCTEGNKPSDLSHFFPICLKGDRILLVDDSLCLKEGATFLWLPVCFITDSISSEKGVVLQEGRIILFASSFLNWYSFPFRRLDTLDRFSALVVKEGTFKHSCVPFYILNPLITRGLL